MFGSFIFKYSFSSNFCKSLLIKLLIFIVAFRLLSVCAQFHCFITVFHIQRIYHLRPCRLTQNVRREIVFHNYFTKRLKFRAVNRVFEGQVFDFTFCTVHYFAEMNVHIFRFLFTDSVEHIVDYTLKIVCCFECAAP